jgi:hypothetical protein
MTPVSPLSLRPLLVAAYTVAAFLVTLVLLGLLEALKPGTEEDLVTLVAAQVLGYAIVAFVALRVHAPDQSLRDFFGVTRPKAVHVLAGLVGGASLYPCLSKLDDLVAHRMPQSEEERAALGRILATDTTTQKVVLGACLLFVLPLTIELFYRGVLFSLAESGGTARAFLATLSASVASSVLYSSSVRALPSLLGFAVLAGLLRATSRSVVPAILAHLGFFAVPLLPGLLLRGYEERYSWPLAIGGAVVAVLVSSLGALRRRPALSPAPPETI